MCFLPNCTEEEEEEEMRSPGRAHPPHNPWCPPALNRDREGGLCPDPSG